jgi:hypothetical protein
MGPNFFMDNSRGDKGIEVKIKIIVIFCNELLLLRQLQPVVVAEPPKGAILLGR